MVTKTAILRPIGVQNDVEIIPSSVGGDTSTAHLYIDDIVADDDATHMEIHALSPENTIIEFSAEHMKNLQSMKIVCRLSPLAEGYGLSFCSAGPMNDDGTYTYSSLGGIVMTGIGSWQTYSLEVTDFTIINNDIAEINAKDGVNKFYLALDGESSKDGDCCKITQLYIDIVYEEEENENVSLQSIYFKKNNEWKLINGVHYIKQDGSWIQQDIIEWTVDDKVTVLEI